jgi:hypothetical protein
VSACEVVFGHVDTPYFVSNPTALDGLPLLDRFIPTLRAETCAQHLANLAKAPRYRAIYPFMLRPNLWFARLFPRAAAWLLRF